MDTLAVTESARRIDPDTDKAAVPALRREYQALKAMPRKLARLELFDAETPELLAAWEKRSLPGIEELLRAGDRLTRDNWQQGIALFNGAIDRVDEARELLRQALLRCEAELSSFDLDYARIKCARSKVVAGYAAPAQRKHFLMEKIEYGKASGLTLSRFATGQLPWQAALVAGVAVGVWHLASRSKALRQLKEMEGKLVLASEAAAGDFALFRTLLRTRIAPQLKSLLDSISKLERGLAALRALSPQHPQARRRAHLLARVLLEGKALLSTMAGN